MGSRSVENLGPKQVRPQSREERAARQPTGREHGEAGTELNSKVAGDFAGIKEAAGPEFLDHVLDDLIVPRVHRKA